jgi:hypothetical protein
VEHLDKALVILLLVGATILSAATALLITLFTHPEFGDTEVQDKK